MEKTLKSKKTPRCVTVYNRLFDMIKNNDFSDNKKLPSELELSKIMNVSRSTLRQALELLQEDGIIQSVQGKGNFITKKNIKIDKGLEILDNPIHSVLNNKFDEVEIEFRIEIGNDYTSQILEQKSSVILFVDRWFKTKEKIVAYTISVIPIESIVESKIDLTKQKELLKYVEKDVYTLAKSSTLKISYSEISNISSTKYKISDNNKCHLLIETLYSKNSNLPIIFNKHYIPIEEGEIIIYRK